MAEGGDTNNGKVLRRTVTWAAVWTVAIFAVGLGLTLYYGTDDNQRSGTIPTYIFHALFYSAGLGALFALMFHASEEH